MHACIHKIYINAYVYAYLLCMYVNTCIHEGIKLICMHTYIHTYIHVFMYMHMDMQVMKYVHIEYVIG